MKIKRDTTWANKVQRIGGDIIVEEGATLTIQDSMIYSYGRNFKVYGSLIIERSTLRMPYINLAYGFGGDLQTDENTNNGDISISDSFIDVKCFYGFFNRNATVSLRHSIFSGFGRIAGAESEAYNCTFLAAHERYGSIATFGQVKQIKYCSVKGGTSLYYNPELSEDCVVENMLLTGDALLYLEPTATHTITLVDCAFSTKELIDKGFTGRVEIAHLLTVSGELVRDDGEVYTGEVVVPVEYYEGGQWHNYSYSMLDNPVDITGQNKFVSPAAAQVDGFVEESDMVGGNNIVDLVPIDKSVDPSRDCPYCAGRTFYPKAYVINDRWYQNRCRECGEYSLQDTTDAMMYAMREVNGKGRGKGLLKGKPDE